VEEITMEYSDGSEGVEPGASISAHGEDLGAATYDSDHDGVADSVIVGQDEYTVVVTDSDHDGTADSVTGYDAQGHQVQHGPSGDTGVDGSGSNPGSDGSGTADPGSGGSGSGDPATDGDPGGSSGDAAAGSITVVDEQGRAVEVGPPTADMDGDGTADTAIVRNDDGSTTGYTDRNADGEADQITQIGTDNHVTISISDGKGGWDVAATGRLDANGEFVEDAGSGAGDPAAGTDSTNPDNAVGGAVLSDLAAGDPAGDPADSVATTITYTDANGQSYPLGAPTADFDGDGTPDTVVTTLENGTVVGYSDVDGDGRTDQVTQIDPDGTVTIGVPDGNGGWEEAATGHLGKNGEFIADPAPAGI